MGIYQDCFIEARAPLHFYDVFVRPLPDEETAEILVKRLIEIKDRMKHLSELSSNLIKELKEADELDCIPNINNDVDFSELLKGIHKN